jgi:hypothetical protein
MSYRMGGELYPTLVAAREARRRLSRSLARNAHERHLADPRLQAWAADCGITLRHDTPMPGFESEIPIYAVDDRGNELRVS